MQFTRHHTSPTTMSHVGIVELADARQALPFRGMTFPALESQLEQVGIDPTVSALALHVDDAPAGLCVVALPFDASEAEIRSIYVEPHFRGRGHGERLLSAAARHLRDRGFRSASFVYSERLASANVLHRLLSRGDWQPPTPHMRVDTFSIPDNFPKYRRQMEERGAFRRRGLPNEFSIFPWRELTDQERQQVGGDLARMANAPVWLSPFRNEATIAPHFSVGLRHHQRVVGWMIGHQTTPETVRVTKIYVAPEFSAHGLSIQMFTHAVPMLEQRPASLQRLAFCVHLPSSLADFVVRRGLSCFQRERSTTMYRSCRRLTGDE